jgi:arylsulfatase A-like enzyme
VPILFWRPGLAGSTIQKPADTVDIMPTLAAQIGFDLAPGSVDGHCLPEAASCPASGALPAERGFR